MSRPITEFDCFFLSYDEPNADKHWADLLDKAPWSKRVHGVKGFDAAHRACAEQSDTDWFVTVDADNIVMSEFFDRTVDFDPVHNPNLCLSWNGVNMVNGLIYGNGGVKLWSKRFVMNMNSHENADDSRKAVDFCWEADYRQIHETCSEVWINGSPYQAFRVGFREGVKLTLERGIRLPGDRMLDNLHPHNFRNARVWASVGSDVPNGMWAMLGTRMAWTYMADPEWDHVPIRDYDWFKSFFAEVSKGIDTEEALVEAVHEWGRRLRDRTKIELPWLDHVASAFVREALRLRNE